MSNAMDIDTVRVQCPYCLQFVEITIESDVHGSLIQDCEVCCRPWQVTIRRGRHGLRVRVERGD